ncbi:MAG: hypothetical protein K2O52_04540 [Oscillospiraceae bacterium]|nr:hypothetical protein [Oscillospiraceae bacterium]
MDKAYEDEKIRFLAEENGFFPVVPLKENCKESWEYNKKLYKPRNEIEQFFLPLKRFRRVFIRYVFVIQLAMIFDTLFMETYFNIL